MKFLLALMVALSLTFAMQSAVFADGHGSKKEAAEQASENAEDGKKKGKKEEEEPDCE